MLMKVLVTGGAGFIGSNLVKKLLMQGDEVFVLDNFLSGYKQNLSNVCGARLVEGDIRNSDLLDKLMTNVEIIYHLAASVGNKRSIDNPFLDADINVRGTLCVLEAARQHHVKKIIVTSSAGIFGELKTLPIKEDHPIEPRTPYASSKLYAEKIALAYADLYGIEAVCLRYFNVYDVVQANIKAAQKPGLIGAFNIASGTQITLNQLIDELISISGIQPIIQYQTPRPGDVRHSLADITAAKNAFSYSPRVSLSKGLKEYVAWVKSEIKEMIELI